MPKRYCYDYPRPMVTVDVALFRAHERKLETLLVKRRAAPFKDHWALPGGFVQMKESLQEAALRELKEETASAAPSALLQLGAYGKVNRDPRGRCISIAFIGIARGAGARVKSGSDAAEAGWHPVEDLPKRLAFDHADILGDALLRLVATGRATGLLFTFLPAKFSLGQLEALLHTIYGLPQDPMRYLSAFLDAKLVRRLAGQDPMYSFVGRQRGTRRQEE